MPGGAEDRVTAFRSFNTHVWLRAPLSRREFEVPAGGGRNPGRQDSGERACSTKELFTQTRDEKKPEQTRSLWPPIALVPGFSLTCHGTFRVAVFDLFSFGVIWAAEAKKRIFVPAHAILALLTRSVL